MQNILNKIAQAYMASEEGHRDIANYLEMRRHPGWNVHRAFLIHMGSHLADAVLSRHFRKDPDKIVRLEAYSMVSEVIKFLLNPMHELQRVKDFEMHNIKAEKTAMGLQDRQSLRKAKQAELTGGKV